MRLKERLTSNIQLAETVSEKNSIGETIIGWGEKRQIKATVTPISDALRNDAYTQRSETALSVITLEPIKTGEGVWLDGDVGDEPAWLVESSQKWTGHYSATIVRRVV